LRGEVKIKLLFMNIELETQILDIKLDIYIGTNCPYVKMPMITEKIIG
jgi:hypothetical protein